MLSRHIMRVLAVLIALLVAFSSQGCLHAPKTLEVDEPPFTDVCTPPPETMAVVVADDARPDDGIAFVSWETASAVPFLVATEDSSLQETYFLGVWDLDKGKVTIGSDPLFSTPKTCKVFWNGGKEFVHITPQASDTTVILRDKRLSIHLADLEPSKYLTAAALDDSHAIFAAYPHTDRQAVLRIEDRTTEKEIQLNPPDLASSASLLGPVAMDIRCETRVDIYLEAFSSDAAGNIVCSLVAASWDGLGVSWRVVCPDMGLTEAGPGAVKAKVGGALALSDHRVRLLDLESGKITSLSSLDRSRAEFCTEYVTLAEYMTPANLGGYQGILIAQWDIPSVRDVPGAQAQQIPTAFLVAVRDGEMVGVVKSVDGYTWVEKDGNVTQEIVSFPGRWIFPQEH